MFNTLNTIVDDIFLEIRNNNIGESEHLSRVQIEQWIIQYRSILIKQDVDKGRDINPMYVQEINGIQLEPKDYGALSLLTTKKYRYKTLVTIPKTVDFHFINGIVNVTDIFGNEIQIGTEARSTWQQYRKYTNNDYTCYIKGDYLYVEGPGELEFINVRGVFEDPSEVSGDIVTGDERYPIPSNMITTLKDMILDNELRLYAMSDNSNDSKDDTDVTEMLKASIKSKRKSKTKE